MSQSHGYTRFVLGARGSMTMILKPGLATLYTTSTSDAGCDPRKAMSRHMSLQPMDRRMDIVELGLCSFKVKSRLNGC